MLKILLDCERMKYIDTGLYHFCLSLGNTLKEVIDPQIEDIGYYTPTDSSGIFGRQAEYIYQKSLHKFSMPSLNNYHIWHSTYQNSSYVPFLNKKIKVVLTIHDLNFLYMENKPESKKQKYLKHMQSLIDRCDAITCISNYCMEDVLNNLNVKNKPIYMIYNGSNHLAEPSLSINSYKPKKPFLFSVGVIQPKKNFHTLMPLLEKNKEMDLVIAGRPDDKDYYDLILKTASDYGVRDNVHLTGRVTEKEKSWYFNNCQAFVFPSLSEGFGLPVTEAMSVGKPIFLSKHTSLPEIGGDAAFYFPSFNDDAMCHTFLNGMAHYKKANMQHSIIKRGREFNWLQSAKQYLDVYRSLC